MRNITATGIIIKRRDTGEMDKIITVFTETNGKMVVKAKGARKITSRRLSHLELLNHVTVSLHTAGRIPIVTEINTLENFSLIKSDLKKIGLAYHVCELIDGLCPENQEQKEVFYLFKELLQTLAARTKVAFAMHRFEIDLLTILGYYSYQDLSGSKASLFIESILERKLKSRQILPYLLQ